MTLEDSTAPPGAVRLGRLLRRATAGVSRVALTAAQRRAFEGALAGAPVEDRGAGIRRGWWWAAGCATAVALVVAISGTRGGRSLTFELDGVGAGPAGAATLEPRGAMGTMRFSDGSTLQLGQGSRARVLGVDARGARLAVERGDVAFQIHHRRETRWAVAAGPFEILVTGTTFDVRWTDDQQLRVRLREGSVVVRGSLAGAGLEMKAGQTLVARVAAGEVRLGREAQEPAAEHAAKEVGAAARATVPEEAGDSARVGTGADTPGTTAPALPTTASTPTASTPTAARPGAGPGAHRVVAKRSPKSEPVDDCTARCDDEQLDAFARQARRNGQLDVARRALLALRKRGTTSELGHEAAFMLGRMAEAQGRAAEALPFYDAYLDSEGGHYRPYALGRKMALVEQLEGAAAARPLAEQYLRLYPDGAHGMHARQLLDGR